MDEIVTLCNNANKRWVMLYWYIIAKGHRELNSRNKITKIDRQKLLFKEGSQLVFDK